MDRQRSTHFAFAIAVVFASLAGIAPAFAAKPDSVPDWVRDAANQTLPKYPAKARAVVLLEDMTYTVSADGQAVEHVRKVIKILRPEGRDEGIVHVDFDNDTKVLSMHVWSIAPDGHEYAVKDNELFERGAFDGVSIYNDNRYKVANPPGRDPGGVVAYEYEQRARPYLTEKTWFLQGDIPRLHESFTLMLPAGFTYGTVWSHQAPAPVVDLEHQRWRWTMDNVAMVDTDDVPLSPSDGALAGRMTVHYGGPSLPLVTDGTWQSIGVWYNQLSRDRFAATPEIVAKAAELTAGKGNFYDKASAIANFVQKDVRYVAIEVGVGGYQPHAAADVFRNRYGDCKDKATLLSSMLSTVGIHAALVMVDVERGVIDPNAPSIVGDHMITAIELPKDYQSDKLSGIFTAKTGKRYFIFDPTWEKTPFGQFEHELQGSYGILMEGADTQAIELPVLKPDRSTILRSGHLQLAADGKLQGTVTLQRYGDLSDYWREVYTHADQKKQQDLMNQLLGQDLSAFDVKDLKVENVDSLDKQLTTTFSLDADHFGKSMGTLLMVRPRVLGSDRVNADRKVRMLPIDLTETKQEKDEYDIDIPAGYVVDEVPNPINLDVGFASYSSKTETRGNTLHFTRTYTVREVTLPAEKYGDVQKLAGVINMDEQSSAVLKKQ